MLQAAADHLEQGIGQYNPQNVCNILWTYATLGYYPGGSPLDVAADYALHALEVIKTLLLCSLFTGLSLSPVILCRLCTHAFLLHVVHANQLVFMWA